MSAKGQGHSLTFVQGNSVFKNFEIFYSEITEPIEANLWSLHGMIKQNFVQMVQVSQVNRAAQ